MKTLMLCFLVGLVWLFINGPVVAAEDWPTLTLPLNNLIDLPTEEIHATGEHFPGGWREFYTEYKWETGHEFEPASPFTKIIMIPYTRAMWYIQAIDIQRSRSESDEWAENYFQEHDYISQGFLIFQIFAWSQEPVTLEQEQFSFSVHDNLGTVQAGEIFSFNRQDDKSPEYSATIYIYAHLPPNPEEIEWFGLEIGYEESPELIQARWSFQE